MKMIGGVVFIFVLLFSFGPWNKSLAHDLEYITPTTPNDPINDSADKEEKTTTSNSLVTPLPDSEEEILEGDENEGPNHFVINPYAPKDYIFASPIPNNSNYGQHFGNRIFNSAEFLKEVVVRAEKQVSDDLPLMIGLDRKAKIPKFKSEKFSTKALPVFWQSHSGTDIRVPVGTPVKAVYPGKVFFMGPIPCPGNVLILRHDIPGQPLPVFSLYKHLSKFRKLSIGDSVEMGEDIALSGNTGAKLSHQKGYKSGCIAGAHLHFEVRIPHNGENLLTINNELAPQIAGSLKNPKQLVKLFYEFENTQTFPANPADYIEEADKACAIQKSAEILNAIDVEKSYPTRLPPLNAGFCSLKMEKAFHSYFGANIPRVYKIYNLESISEFFPEAKPMTQAILDAKSKGKPVSNKTLISLIMPVKADTKMQISQSKKNSLNKKRAKSKNKILAQSRMR